jgi:hypothetical protein
MAMTSHAQTRGLGESPLIGFHLGGPVMIAKILLHLFIRRASACEPSSIPGFGKKQLTIKSIQFHNSPPAS